MSARTCSAILFAACVALALAGCASPSAQVIARCGPHPMPAGAKKIALLKQGHPSPEDEALERAVAAELETRGFQIVPQPQAELTLACRAEENCHRYLRVVQEGPPFQSPPHVPMIPGAGYVVMEQRPLFPSPRRYVEDAVDVRGIRLQVYPTQQLLAGRFETAWEGYIEAGFKLRPEQQRTLIRTLLDQFGRDFTGKVKLAPQP